MRLHPEGDRQAEFAQYPPHPLQGRLAGALLPATQLISAQAGASGELVLGQQVLVADGSHQLRSAAVGAVMDAVCMDAVCHADHDANEQ
ncbi:MAG: hypothetical protein ACRDST_14755 [Pseudonocardiaceae bacterium]